MTGGRGLSGWARLAIAGLLAVQAGLLASSAGRASLTADEEGHYRVGLDFLRGELGTTTMQRMPVTAINAAAASLRSNSSRLVSPPRIRSGRWPTFVLTVAIGLLIGHWAGRRYGGAAAVAAVALWVFDPTVLAHGGLVTNDVAAAGAMLVAVVVFERWLEHRTRGWLVMSAVVTGLAQVVKHTSLLLLPILGALWLLSAPRRVVSRPLRSAGGLIAYGLIALVALDVSYGLQTVGRPVASYELTNPALTRLASPFAAVPVPLPAHWLEALRFGRLANATPGVGHGLMYLLGELRLEPWRHYFPVAAALKFPLPLILLSVAAAFTLVREGRAALARELAVWLPPALVFAFFTLMVNVQIGVRYLLPMLPFLHVLAARLVRPGAPRGVRWSVAALLVLQAASVLSYHPHYIPYMNELVTDRTTAWRYLADSNLDWGQADDELERWLETTGEDVQIRPAGPVAGRVVVGVNELVGVHGGPHRYRWLRECCAPVAHVAHAWLVFDVPGTAVPLEGQVAGDGVGDGEAADGQP